MRKFDLRNKGKESANSPSVPEMDFKSRIQGKNTVMDKSGIYGLVKRQANPVNKSQGLLMRDPSFLAKQIEEKSTIGNDSAISMKMFNPRFINIFQSPKKKEEQQQEEPPQKEFHPKTNVPDQAYKELKKNEKIGRSKFITSTPKDEIYKRVLSEKEKLNGPRLIPRLPPDLLNQTPAVAPLFLQDATGHLPFQEISMGQEFGTPYQSHTLPPNPNLNFSPEFQETIKSLYIATNQFQAQSNLTLPIISESKSQDLPYHPYSIVYDYKYKPPRILKVNHNEYDDKMENMIKDNRSYQDLEFNNRLQGVNESYLKKFKSESKKDFEKLLEMKEEPKKYQHLIDEYAEKNKEIMKKFNYLETLKRLKDF